MPNSIQVLQEPALTSWLERIRGKPSPSAGKGGREEDEEEQEEGADAGEVYEPDELAEKVLNMIRNGRPMKLEEAVRNASSAFGAKPEEVARRIYELSSAGLVAIRDPNPPRSPLGFLRDPAYSAWYWALIALVAGTVAVVAASPGAPLIYIRYALGSLFVLYLPGAALIELLYPRKSDLSQLERLALSLGLSLALVPLIGLVLNYTPWGIRLEPILASVSLLTVGLATGALVRKHSYVRLQAAALGSSAGRANA
ncbi:MAG: DUF1616 domain-containing protein [Candidatus Methanosuratincola petrocarbonis]